MPVSERASGDFAMVARDEVWLLGIKPVLREERLSHGSATLAGRDIIASDAVDEDLLAISAREIEAARSRLPSVAGGNVVARVIVNARHTAGGMVSETALALTAGTLSIVTTPANAAVDCDRLVRIAAHDVVADVDYRGIPMAWRNGSGAVLLHEAAGHPAEHHHPPIDWPRWLSVRDEPLFTVDDAGRVPATADLLAGETPSAIRRASFADVPLRRLSNVVVRQKEAPFALPEERLDILLVAGGEYDPLTEMVRLFVSAAELVSGNDRRRVRPFVIEERRRSVAGALTGAQGQPERYPGVVCSAEGQEIVVGSHAPLLTTEF